MNSSDRIEEPLAIALEQALARALPRPELPPGFRMRLQAALAGAPALDHSAALRAMENEHNEQLLILHADFVRLRRRTLGTLIGVAFAAGATIAASMPWITTSFGPNAMLLGPTLGAAVGVAIGLAAWLRREDIAHWLF
jgi:hypothetical protein